MALNIENEASLRVAMSTGFNLFLGAGFSVLAKDGAGKPMPVGGALADELREAFDVDRPKVLSLPQIYTVLAARDRVVADKFLTRRFTVGSLDDRYKLFDQLAIRTLYTTNIDDVPWHMFEKSSKRYVHDVFVRGSNSRDKAALSYVPLHGSVRDDTRPYRFTSVEISASFNSDPQVWQGLRNDLRDSPTIFWGYSLADAATLEAIGAEQSGGFQTRGEKWLVLRPVESDDPRIEYFKALDFQLIFGETTDLLDFVKDVASSISSGVGERSSAPLLEEYWVPGAASVAQRPLVDFFAGSAPVWSDVFRAELPRLDQFRQAANAINSGANVIISGIPTCGKTTLLMQLAADGVGRGQILFLGSATLESARRILHILDGAESTIYVDRICDDVEAWNLLCLAPNVTAVGADRDYNTATVTHILLKRSLQFVSLSEVAPRDLAIVFDRIPRSIRCDSRRDPNLSQGVRPSLLDFNLVNLTSSSMKERLVDAIREFQISDPHAAEMLLLIAYVHACGTPLSMDMAVSYWREEYPDWGDVTALFARVGLLANEVTHEFVDGDQDYFGARSVSVAEHVVSSPASSRLRTMLEKFHYRISPTRIARFDVFRRRGYSHRYVDRAFPNLDDGVKFYDYLLDRDRNPYLLQQKALLYNKRRRYVEGFATIDEALSMTQHRNWTIAATHAEMLFDANFSLESSTADALTQIHRAMDILSSCFQSDNRRSLHAFSLSKKAIDFWHVHRNEVGREYLETAQKLLLEVQRRETHMTATRFLLRDVEACLVTN